MVLESVKFAIGGMTFQIGLLKTLNTASNLLMACIKKIDIGELTAYQQDAVYRPNIAVYYILYKTIYSKEPLRENVYSIKSFINDEKGLGDR